MHRIDLAEEFHPEWRHCHVNLERVDQIRASVVPGDETYVVLMEGGQKIYGHGDPGSLVEAVKRFRAKEEQA